MPVCLSQQGRDPPISVPPVCARQPDDRSRQRVFVRAIDPFVALCSSPLPQQPAGMSLGYLIRLARMPDRATPPPGAQKFPAATSFKICFSSDSSATSRFSLLFSFSSSFRRFA